MEAASPICLEIDRVWKVFGNKPQRALELAEAGESRAAILDKTDCTIGVRDVSFEVKRGETFVVMGLSGSGKSTLIRCIAQLTDVTQGTVALDGEALTAMNEDQLREVRRQKLSMVFQHFGLLPHRRVIDNVAYGLEVQGVPRDQRHARATEVLGIVGLAGWGEHYPQQLSGGMQQRVGLARALIRRDMQDELIRLQSEMQRTIVFITHDFAEAIKLGDRIAIMKDGAFDQIGTAAELITHPATDYVREFTEDIPKAKVLTAADVMHAVNGAEPRGTVSGEESVEALLPSLLVDPRPLAVVDVSGATIGIVDRAAVAAVLEA
jgi:glycine betaine/proline transport system ATP-binding protein